MTTARLTRTFQTAPAGVPKEDTAKYLRSALGSEGFGSPDWLVPDLEDGTAPDMKDAALENTVALVPEHAASFAGEIWPRVQWAHDVADWRDRGREQIDTLAREAGDHLAGFVVPKVGRLDDVRAAAEAIGDAEREYGLDGLELSVIVETAEAKSDLREIAAFGRDSRLAGLVFGPVDYTAELGGREIGGRGPRWSGLLEDLSNEASANDLVAVGGPFDQLFRERAGVRFYNGDGYADHVEREARVGLDGSWSLHPQQTAQANRIHTPAPDELARAIRVIEEFDAAKTEGTGAVTIDGQMVDEATYKNFANTAATARAIRDSRPEQAATIYGDDLLEKVRGIEI